MIIRGYLRISKATDESNSLEIQRDRITRYRDTRYPGTEIAWYPDEGISGAKSEKLRSRIRLLDEIQSGDVLLATKLDRLGRSTRDLLDIASHVRDSGAILRFTEQDISTDGPMGQLLFTMLAAFADFELAMITERTTAVRKAALAKGRYVVGRLPFWLTAEEAEGIGSVIRPNDRAMAFKAGILEFTRGEVTQAALAEHFGIHPTTLSAHLRNTWLRGVNPEDGGIRDEKAAILSETEWLALQGRLQTRIWTRTESYAEVLKCWRCKKRMHWNRTNGKYWCHGADPKHDSRPVVDKDATDEMIESYFLREFGPMPMVEVVPEDNAAKTEALASVEIDLAEATEAMRLPGADIATLAERVTELAERRTEIEAMPVTETIYRQSGETVEEMWKRLDTSGRAKLMAEMIEITVYPARGEHKRPNRFEFEVIRWNLPRAHGWIGIPVTDTDL